MYQRIFETHAHYDEACYAPYLDQLLKKQRELGVEYIVNSSSSIPSAHNAVRLSIKYDFIYATVGIYPLEATGLPEGWLQEVEELAMRDKVVAIGEIGLDYHEKNIDKAIQRKVFCAQLELAKRLSLPVQIHNRNADEDTLAILREYRPKQIILHRFSSPSPYDERFLELGCYLSFCCSITYPAWAFLLDTAKAMPLESLLLETDSPFLAPAHLANEISTSDMISFVAERIAQVRSGYSAQDILDATYNNAMRAFSIGSGQGS